MLRMFVSEVGAHGLSESLGQVQEINQQWGKEPKMK